MGWEGQFLSLIYGFQFPVQFVMWPVLLHHVFLATLLSIHWPFMCRFVAGLLHMSPKTAKAQEETH